MSRESRISLLEYALEDTERKRREAHRVMAREEKRLVQIESDRAYCVRHLAALRAERTDTE